VNRAIQALAFLLGAWEGEGRGLWAADEPFRYRERVDYCDEGGPFVTYRQETWTLGGERSLHRESGYLRAGQGRSVEMVLAQPTGLVEVHEGRLSGQRIELRSIVVGCTPRALRVTDTSRSLSVSGDQLRYELALAMNHEALSPHLEGHLRRGRGG
jgi:hypothetical protein